MAIDVARIEEVDRSIPARTTGERADASSTYAILLAVSALFFVPFLWTISTSLKTCPRRRDSTCCRTTRACGPIARS